MVKMILLIIREFMEEYINKLVTITYIREALSSTYNELDTANICHDCMELINEVEKDIVLRLTASTNYKDVMAR